MAPRRFSWLNFLIRLMAALIVVFATYNPEGFSYYHWITEDLAAFDVLKAFVGVVLVIGWAILLRATVRSLGPFGILLAIAFFGLLTWLILDYAGLSADNQRVVTYVVQIVIVGVMAAGVSWSHIRRRVSGQYDTDDVDN